MMKAVAVGAMLLGVQAFGTSLEKAVRIPSATCKCKNAADCTCPKGQCKCKHCGHSVKVFDTLTGSHETTRLPNTARSDDARGGIFI